MFKHLHKKSKNICIYHANCMDGFSSAWVVRKVFGKEVTFIEGHHVENKEAPDVTGCDVYIVDFSYNREIMKEIISTAKSTTVLDHHLSAERNLDGLDKWASDHGYIYNVTFDMNHSGAILTWNHFFPNDTPPDLLLHVEDRDLWKFKLANTREIAAAVFSYEYSFEIYDKLMTMDLSNLISDGMAIDRKHFKDINEMLPELTRKMIIGGVEVKVANVLYFQASDVGQMLATGEPFGACYYDTATERKFGLRSAEDGVDVSKIAEKYKGGGHKHAAGFSVPIGWEGE